MKNSKLPVTKKVILNYGFSAVVSFALLIALSFGWFITSRDASVHEVSLKSYSNNLSTTMKIYKNNSEIVNTTQIFRALVSGDVFRFEITVSRESSEPINLSLDIEGIETDEFVDGGITYKLTDLFNVKYNEVEKSLSECDANGTIRLSDSISWNDNNSKVIEVTMTFQNLQAVTDSNVYSKKSFNFSGFSIRQIGI